MVNGKVGMKRKKSGGGGGFGKKYIATGVNAPPATKEALRAQVEFYFSDSNLPADSFLMGKVVEAESDGGFVDLKLICTFTRMREKLRVNRTGLITQEMVDKVAESLQDSAEVAVRRCETDANKVMVKRIKALMDKSENEKDIDGKSVLARPFPMDASIDNVRSFFEKAILKPAAGNAEEEEAPPRATETETETETKTETTNTNKVVSVRFRRHTVSKDFNGTLFVEFATVEDAREVVRIADTEPGVTYADMRLTVMPKEHFCENVLPGEELALDEARKKESEVVAKLAKEEAAKLAAERAAAAAEKEKASEAKDAHANGVKENGDGGALEYVRGTVVFFNVVKPTPAAAEDEDDKANDDDDDVEDDGDIGLSREDVRDSFAELGEVVYVSFSRGASLGHVQFKDPSKATAGVEKMKKDDDGHGSITCGGDAKIELNGIRILAGDEELEYWKKVREHKLKFKDKKRSASSSAGFRNKGGRGGKGKGFVRHRGGFKKR